MEIVKDNKLVVRELLSAVTLKKPTLNEVLECYGNWKLIDYSNSFYCEPPGTEEYEQFINVATLECGRLLGWGTAEKLRKRLETNAAILTANHHGPEWLDITINGNLVFALAQILNQENGVVPIFAFGGVPLNNRTWGMGMIIGENKLKLHPDVRQQVLVTHAPALTRQDIINGLAKIESMDLPTSLKNAAWNILADIFLTDDVLSQPNFSSQSTVINHRLWPWLFSEELRPNIPELTCLQMETIVINLLLNFDLRNESSLMHQIFFDPILREILLKELEGKYGCWDQQQINLLHDAYLQRNDDQAKELEKGSGTTFFWGVDEKGKRYPFVVIEDENRVLLRGVTKRGREVIIPFKPENIDTELQNKRITPSLFTDFAVLFERLAKCYGGFMQIDYLTSMKDGLVSALKKADYHPTAEKISNISTNNYSTGMTVILVEGSEGEIIRPAGTVDIIAGGGLDLKTLDKIGGNSVKELNLLGLPSMYQVVYRPEERKTELLNITLSVISELLGENLVRIRI